MRVPKHLNLMLIAFGLLPGVAHSETFKPLLTSQWWRNNKTLPVSECAITSWIAGENGFEHQHDLERNVGVLVAITSHPGTFLTCVSSRTGTAFSIPFMRVLLLQRPLLYFLTRCPFSVRIAVMPSAEA